MPSPTEITVAQLARLIGLPECPVIVDVCTDDDFAADPNLIPTAIRHPFSDIATLAPALAARRVVVVCQKGLKLSQGAAAVLRCHHIHAESLAGGMIAWRDAGAPVIAAKALPPRNRTSGSVWVTRQRPKIDRIACPWLIRRFVDRDAQFLYVEPGQVIDVAEKFGAIPFDTEGVFWSHRDELCTFDVMLEEFGLKTEPLLRLATIVRGADTDRHDLAPQAAGLLAASLGLSRMYRDDLQQLEAGFALYDAFYRWARDAHEETHDWPARA